MFGYEIKYFPEDIVGAKDSGAQMNEMLENNELTLEEKKKKIFLQYSNLAKALLKKNLGFTLPIWKVSEVEGNLEVFFDKTKLFELLFDFRKSRIIVQEKTGYKEFPILETEELKNVLADLDLVCSDIIVYMIQKTEKDANA